MCFLLQFYKVLGLCRVSDIWVDEYGELVE